MTAFTPLHRAPSTTEGRDIEAQVAKMHAEIRPGTPAWLRRDLEASMRKLDRLCGPVNLPRRIDVLRALRSAKG